MSRASAYAEITRAVQALIAEHADLGDDGAAYLVMRAAMLRIASAKGFAAAAAKAVELGREMLGEGG